MVTAEGIVNVEALTDIGIEGDVSGVPSTDNRVEGDDHGKIRGEGDNQNKTGGEGDNQDETRIEGDPNAELEDDDNIPLALVGRKMRKLDFQRKLKNIATFSKRVKPKRGKSKGTKPKPIRSSSRLVLEEALVENKVKTFQNKRKRKQKGVAESVPHEGVVELSSKESDDELIKSVKKRKHATRKIKRSSIPLSTREEMGRKKRWMKNKERLSWSLNYIMRRNLVPLRNLPEKRGRKF